MKKTLTLSIVLLLISSITQAQTKVIGEKNSAGVIGEKGPRESDAAIAKNNAQVETAFAEYNRQREEMERSLAALHVQIEEGIKLLEKYKRLKSPKQGIVLRNSWRDALKLQEGGKKKISIIKHSVVAPDMIQ